jgi:Cu(I)/Ag(I) efflux system periplasmic protein CusF
MKRGPTLVMTVAVALLSSHAALSADKMDNMPGMDKTKSSAMPAANPAVGVVKQVDAAAGKVTIAHEAIKTLGWPAMTMSFSVKDKMLFDKLAVGKKVNFEVAKQGDDYVVTAVK